MRSRQTVLQLATCRSRVPGIWFVGNSAPLRAAVHVQSHTIPLASLAFAWAPHSTKRGPGSPSTASCRASGLSTQICGRPRLLTGSYIRRRIRMGFKRFVQNLYQHVARCALVSPCVCLEIMRARTNREQEATTDLNTIIDLTSWQCIPNACSTSDKESLLLVCTHTRTR